MNTKHHIVEDWEFNIKEWPHLREYYQKIVRWKDIFIIAFITKEQEADDFYRINRYIISNKRFDTFDMTKTGEWILKQEYSPWLRSFFTNKEQMRKLEAKDYDLNSLYKFLNCSYYLLKFDSTLWSNNNCIADDLKYDMEIIDEFLYQMLLDLETMPPLKRYISECLATVSEEEGNDREELDNAIYLDLVSHGFNDGDFISVYYPDAIGYTTRFKGLLRYEIVNQYYDGQERTLKRNAYIQFEDGSKKDLYYAEKVIAENILIMTSNKKELSVSDKDNFVYICQDNLVYASKYDKSLDDILFTYHNDPSCQKLKCRKSLKLIKER